MTRFGDNLKGARIATRITLREFCHQNGLDCGNMSKYERGLLMPPSDPEKIIGWYWDLGYPKNDEFVARALLAAMDDLIEAIEKKFKEAVGALMRE